MRATKPALAGRKEPMERVTPIPISSRMIAAGDLFEADAKEPLPKGWRRFYNEGFKAAVRGGLAAVESPQQAAAQGVDDAS